MGIGRIVLTIVPAQGKVHSCNYVTIAVCLCPSCLLGHYLNAIVAGCRNHSFVRRNYFCVGVRKVNLYYVCDLTVCQIIIVEYDLGLDNTGGEFVIFFGNEIVVIVVSCIISHYCEYAHRYRAYQHNYCKSHCQDFGKRFCIHLLFLLLIFYINHYVEYINVIYML